MRARGKMTCAARERAQAGTLRIAAQGAQAAPRPEKSAQ